MSNTPNISTPAWPTSSSTALLFMLDLDWPLAHTRVSHLHWLATSITLALSPDGTPSPSDENSTALLSIPSPFAVQYLPPAPPTGDVAHTYAFFLFATPASFSLPAQYADLGAADARDENGTLIPAEARAGFDVDVFLADCGLSEADLLARNHVRVRDLAGSPEREGGFPPAREEGGVMGQGEGLDGSQGPEGNGTVGGTVVETEAATGGAVGRGLGGMGSVWSVVVSVVVAGLVGFVG